MMLTPPSGQWLFVLPESECNDKGSAFQPAPRGMAQNVINARCLVFFNLAFRVSYLRDILKAGVVEAGG